MEVSVTVSVGELLDKISILEIKRERIKDAAKLTNVTRELELLTAVRDLHISSTGETTALVAELKKTNESLWEIEDEIREWERVKDFGERFVALARSVYFTNDRRSALKNRLNILTGSAIIEEKSYQEY